MEDEERASCVFDSPVGRLKVAATTDGICALTWLKEGGEAEETPDPRDCARARRHLRTCTDWLTAYFSGSLLECPVPRPPLDIPKKGATMSSKITNFPSATGTFSHSVWCALCETEVGDTLSYGQLAKLAGNPAAARAVGQAMRKHCIPLLIPCHRVVKGGGGGLGSYSGGEGTSTKQWLLQHESKMATKTPST